MRNNLHHCPHLLLSGCLQLTLSYLTTKSCSLHHHTGGLLDTSVFCQLLPLHPCSVACQCPILLLHPLLFLLLKLIGIWIVVFLRVIRDQELRYGFTLEIVGHDGIQEFALKMTLVYISGSLEKSSQGSRGALTLRRGHCHDLQCSGACQTYFPWPRPRLITPGTILAEQQCWMRQPKLGCRTQMLTSVHHHFLVHNMYIYIQPVLGISPVWKSTKMSQNPIVRFRLHSEPTALDAPSPSVSNLTPMLSPIIRRPQ